MAIDPLNAVAVAVAAGGIAQVWELRQKKRSRELEGLRWAARRELHRDTAMKTFVEADVQRIRGEAEAKVCCSSGDNYCMTSRHD